jgi:hypothetical protein
MCPVSVRKLALPLLTLAILGGCSRAGEINVDGGVGITTLRSPCPHVAVPAGTGDVTLFTSPTDRTSTAIDVTAVLTNVKSTCDDSTDQVLTSVTFDVMARRASADGARDVQLPYFVTLVRGGGNVVAKRLGHVNLRFEPGQLRASVSGTGTTTVARSAATLPEDVRERLTRKRRAGEEAAAMDPLADPAIRQSVLSASFETLVGFQLTDEQLRYNATR